ncbi:hypothetical protein A2973_05385 [Candidatus Gottesmanbacteria bacterium RIFCSPLOWO2_01_FULL_49_10]|uniref:Peptidase C39-like domain-containing protein n=1 Tax=Candidatus Gottesmanbacteria bacterium RIFCSPLOWO2_01_FULL_49_10 TaxID=1798396 RepID=A0A1F6B1A2_9BACT|nr:MAG: hypothetical protein A2973_05385 [Candidatus Gottesmanbacteria bacterium RIFCSPLOWO2_01_FULL_49_10]
MVHVRFPNHSQLAQTYSCGPICLQNVYEHFGLDVSLDDILTSLRVTENDTTYLSQLAKDVVSRGLDSVIITSYAVSVSPDWEGKSAQEVLSRLDEWAKSNPRDKFIIDATYLRDYLRAGGRVVVTDLSTTLIDTFLGDGYKAVVCLEESWLWGRRKRDKVAQFDDIYGSARGHIVVVFDSTDTEYIVSDPYPTGLSGREGIYPVPKDKLFISMAMWNAEVLMIKK